MKLNAIDGPSSEVNWKHLCETKCSYLMQLLEWSWMLLFDAQLFESTWFLLFCLNA
jgi:hypothetical protein